MESRPSELTTRERFLRCLDFKPVDRAPFIETVGAEDIPRWEREGMPSGVDMFQYFGFDDLRAIAWIETPDPPYECRLIDEDEDKTIEQIDDGSLVERSKHISFQHVIKAPITTMEDWFEYRQRLQPSPDRIPSNPKVNAEIRSSQSAGQCAVRSWLSGFFNYPRKLLGPEPHMIAYHEQPELIRSICDHWLQFSLAMLEEATSLVEIDYFILGEDLAYKNGPFLSAAMFREFLAPYYRPVVQLLHEKGVKHILVDTDGDFRKLIPLYLELGVDGFEPVEVQAGMKVLELRKTYPNIKYLGGVDKRKLYGDPAELERHLHEEIKPVIRQGGYIPGNDHAVPRETSFAQYCHYIEVLKTIL